MTLQCKMRGAEFEAVGANAKFCAECKKQKQREWNRNNYIKQTQGAKVAERYAAAEKQRKDMNEVLAKADAAGLSYGQYVAEERKKSMNKKNEAAPAPKPDIVPALISRALEALEKSEADCEEIGRARGLLTAAKMILEGEP